MKKRDDKSPRLVYSTDAKVNESLVKKCPKCKLAVAHCACVPETPGKTPKFVAYLRIEKGGRGGKTVTVIDELPKVESYLKELTTELKKKCGSGGTYLMDRKEGVIEIQGDKKETIRALLTAKGIKTKG